MGKITKKNQREALRELKKKKNLISNNAPISPDTRVRSWNGAFHTRSVPSSKREGSGEKKEEKKPKIVLV